MSEKPSEHHHADKPACCGANAPAEVASEPRENLNPAAAGHTQTTLRVEGMDCADEVAALEQVFRRLKGVRSMRVNLMGGTAILIHDESVTPRQLIDAVASTGMKATREGTGAVDLDRLTRARRVSVAISGGFTGVGLLAQWMNFPPLLADGAFLIAIVAGGWFIVPKAWRAVRRLALDMNVLMTAAVIGALAIHEWSEGAAVAFLFGLSELLEAASLARARKAVRALMELAPETALLKEGTGYSEVPVDQVPVGATIAVRSGSRVPLDGRVIDGASEVNQAPITGESMPVEKRPGDLVFGGSINGSGSLEICTTKLHTETMIAKIIHLVEEAQSQKAPSQRFVDVFARYYTPAVMLVALLAMLLPPMLWHADWPTWFYRGLVLLVIACPCALVISTPVSVVSGLTAMARRGVLIKGGAVLEALGKLRTLAMDKTGTLTEGRPRVTNVIDLASVGENEILRIAAAIDTHSEHPVARAVVAHAEEQGIAFPRSENYQALHGRGAEGTLQDHPYFVGNHRLAHELAVCTPAIERQLAEIEAGAQSVVVVGHKPHAGCPGGALGIIAVGDALRANAPEAIKAMRRAGITKIVMLSGDNQRTASAIAARAGITEAYGDLLPDQKIGHVKALLDSDQHVGMIGDGVNDAPAMAIAGVGIAMGNGGTDAAIETADMALMQDDLGKVAEALLLGRRTLRTIQFNIAFALAVKFVFLVLAMIGHASLWLAILADTGATLLVILNALRLLKLSPAR